MKTAIITFSPTGGTLRCAAELAKSLGETVQEIDLTERNITERTIADEAEVVVIAVPSYGGRMPSLAVERLKRINGLGKKAVLLTVYGNRAFEDTLVELEDIARAQNFCPTAAVAAIAQHCMDGKIATNRPDTEDIAKLQDFGQKVSEKISKTNKSPLPLGEGQGERLQEERLSLPGNRPYKKAGAGMQPVTDKSCTACGLCAKKCPAEAISPDDPTKIDSKKCLGCMRCVAICPSKSKRLPNAKKLIVHAFLSLAAGKRKEPQLFI